jgi:hypothetical protein
LKEWSLQNARPLYSLQEGARFFALADIPPDPDDAQMAADNLLSAVPTPVSESKPFTPRNIQIVLLESFWDPSELKNSPLQTKPFGSRFS